MPHGERQQHPTTTTSSGLVTLVDNSTLSIDVNIAEADIAKVKPGQRARATFTALTNQTIPGRVTAVSPKATVTSNVVSYVATVALDGEARTDVKTGMTATVAIVVASKAGCAGRAQPPDPGSGPAAIRQRPVQGRAVQRAGHVGLVGDSTSEVVSGLAEGDVIVTAAADRRPAERPRPSRDVQAKPGGFGGFGVKP